MNKNKSNHEKCYNCQNKMEPTDFYCKSCGSGRGFGPWSWDINIPAFYKYKGEYKVKGYCDNCDIELISIQPNKEKTYCPRCGLESKAKVIEKLSSNESIKLFEIFKSLRKRN